MLSEAERQSIIQEITDIRTVLVTKQPMLGLLAAYMSFVMVDDTDEYGDSKCYLAPDGFACVIGAQLWMRLAPQDRVFMMAHEIMHAALQHNQRAIAAAGHDPKRHRLYNMCSDVIINANLWEAGLRNRVYVADMAKLVEDYRLNLHADKRVDLDRLKQLRDHDTLLNMSVDELYLFCLDLLERYQKKQPSSSPSPSSPFSPFPSSSSGCGCPDGTNTEMAPGEPSPSESQSRPGPEKAEKPVPAPGDDLPINPDMPRVDDKRVFVVPGAQSEDADWDMARHIAAVMSAGLESGGRLRAFLLGAEVYEPWWNKMMQLLNPVVGARASYNRVNRRHLWRGVVMPSLVPGKPQVIVYVDTSGSISESQASSFVTSLVAFLGACDVRVRLIAGDAYITYDEIIESAGQVPDHLPGGGGTDFRPFFRCVAEMEKRPDVVVMLTDTMGAYPEVTPPYPVLTVVPPGCKRDTAPPFGIWTYLERREDFTGFAGGET